ncbi:MAG: hypothetical protein WA821_02640 [Anaerolineales bacterium]
MPRNRHKKSQTPHPTPAPAHRSQEVTPSPAALAVAQRIAYGGVDYLKQSLVRVVTDSAPLADEPEFSGLYLDNEKTIQVTDRWLKKYEKRLETAKNKGSGKYGEVFDEMRIEAIAELATPAFRKDVKDRVNTLLDRLMTTNDADSLEIAMLLKSALATKSIPWGLCGLVIAIYNRTMQRAMQAYEEEKELYDSIAEAVGSGDKKEVDLLTAFKQPNKIEQVAQKVFGARPGLRDRLEKQVWDLVDAFEDKLMHGDVDLNLFSEEELALLLRRIEAEFGEITTQTPKSDEMSKRTFELIRQVIAEIMTPERFRRFREDVKRTAEAWFHARQKWAAALQAELSYLDENQYEENKFILAAFLGQLYHLGKEHKPAAKSKKGR